MPTDQPLSELVEEIKTDVAKAHDIWKGYTREERENYLKALEVNAASE